jgi:hypothetical protein
MYTWATRFIVIWGGPRRRLSIKFYPPGARAGAHAKKSTLSKTRECLHGRVENATPRRIEVLQVTATKQLSRFYRPHRFNVETGRMPVTLFNIIFLTIIFQ